MRLIGVNIGSKRELQNGTRFETTGIYKRPAAGDVQVTPLGLHGDFIGNLKHHGGPDQAIYVYGISDYEYWEQELGTRLEPGTFGENLTVSGLESAGFRIGDRLQMNGVVLEITAPRTPCSTLASRMGDAAFGKKYGQVERPGLYCRVIQAGMLRAGDEVRHIRFSGESVSALDMFRYHHRHEKDEEMARRILKAPISGRARASLERDLRRALASETEGGPHGEA